MLWVISLGLFMAMLDVSIVTVALPSIQEGIGASESDIQWVVAGYALAFGILQVAAGRAGDLFGRELLFIVGVIAFAAASAWCGLAADPIALDIARVLQGLGAGVMVPQVVGMIQQYFRGADRGRAFGIFGGVVGVAVAIGPTLGGFLIHAFGHQDGWRTIFFINLPVAVAAISLALAWFPRPLLGTHRHDATPARSRRDLDLIGTMLLGVSLLAVLLPFVEPRASWLVLLVGLALLAAWVAWEHRYLARGRSPMVDLRIFSVASFRDGTLLVGLYFFGSASIWVILNLYFQSGLHHSALEAGLLGLPSAIGTGVTSVWAGRRVAKYGRGIVVAGIFLALVGLMASILVVYLHALGTVSEWWLLPTLVLFNIGAGAVVSPNQTLTLEDVPLEYAGSSGGIMQTVQQVGTSIGLAVVTAVTFSVLAVSSWSTAFIVGLASIAVLIGAAQVVALADLRRRRREDAA